MRDALTAFCGDAPAFLSLSPHGGGGLSMNASTGTIIVPTSLLADVAATSPQSAPTAAAIAAGLLQAAGGPTAPAAVAPAPGKLDDCTVVAFPTPGLGDCAHHPTPPPRALPRRWDLCRVLSSSA